MTDAVFYNESEPNTPNWTFPPASLPAADARLAAAGGTTAGPIRRPWQSMPDCRSRCPAAGGETTTRSTAASTIARPLASALVAHCSGDLLIDECQFVGDSNPEAARFANNDGIRRWWPHSVTSRID
jgi:hypothetical protein